MLSEKEIMLIAQNFINKIEKRSKIETVLVKEATIRKNYGIIFFYTSKKYYESRNENDNTLAGGGPFLIDNTTGEIIQFGSYYDENYYIKEYEAGRWPLK